MAHGMVFGLEEGAVGHLVFWFLYLFLFFPFRAVLIFILMTQIQYSHDTSKSNDCFYSFTPVLPTE